jgi:RimJ/RimL family protein N-acetyltransferase
MDRLFGWRRRRQTDRHRQGETMTLAGTEVIEGRLVRLRPKRLEDAPQDYQWRRDAELSSFDAIAPTTASYEEFLREFHYDLASLGPRRKRFAIETLDGKHIGNCSLFNIDDKRRQAELGIMIGDRNYWSKGYGADTVRTLVAYAFRELPVDKVYLYTLDWNLRAQHSFAKAGFKEVTRIADERNRFVVMETYRPTEDGSVPTFDPDKVDW